MSKLTSSYKNDNLIKIAKQQYDQKQKKSIPSEIVTLTSKGQVYPIDSPLRSGTVEMRYMTAYDEDILTNASYMKEGVTIDKLLEALIVTPIDYKELAAVDKDGLILYARILSYGSEYAVKVKDPKSGNSLDKVVNLSQLKTKTLDIESNDQGEFLYEVPNLQLKFKFPTIATVDAETISAYLSNIITEVNGKRQQSDIDHFIKYDFLIKDSKKFQDYIIKNTPSIILEQEFEGEDGSTFTSTFPIGLDFFWL
tara:strand:- start:160 stop:918 length:759 start_codon:yes stop_codon:yes gene_type:complete